MIELSQDYWLYFLIGQYPNGPLGGLTLTVLLASAALVQAMPLGPLLLVVFWAYFFLLAVTGVKTGQATTMLMTLVLFDAVYLAGIVATGIRALPKGQLEGARSLGLGYGQALRLVILPQALRHVSPSLVSQLVATIKATSPGYIIGLSEVSFVAAQVNTLVFTKAV